MADFNCGSKLAEQIHQEFVTLQNIIQQLEHQNHFLYSVLAKRPQSQIILTKLQTDFRRSADAVTDADGRYVYLRKAETKLLYQIDTETGQCIEIPCTYFRCSMHDIF